MGSSTDLPDGVQPGEILAKKYRVVRLLGAGAMGVVVEAHHLGLDTRVAIKLLQPALSSNKEVVERFAQEARAAAKITNDHVVRVLDVGVLETGAPFMVMEYLDGTDLHAWIETNGPLPVDLAVDFVLQAAEAIVEAHRIGIVHRDLKPSNLFSVQRTDGTFLIKVLDFGISKVMSGRGLGASLSMTRTATVMGTPLYMSPEQMESSRGVDARTDVWALGVILYELLAGRSPFHGEDLPEVCLKIATRQPPPLSLSRSDVPEVLEAAILSCLEKDRDRRCQTVTQLSASIAEFGSRGPSLPPVAPWRMTGPAPGTRSAIAPGSSASSPYAQASPRPSLAGSIAAVGHTRPALSRKQTGVLGALGVTVALGLFVLVARAKGSSEATTPTALVSAAPLPPAASSASLVPARGPDTAELPSLNLPLKSSGPSLASAPASASAAPADAAPSARPKPRRPQPPQRIPAGAVPSAPTDPEPAKSSSPYDERL